MQELISVIVPIYKVEPYLRSCVDSILTQTYRNLEVILVDDGSPDRCPEVCDSYLGTDPRVKVIHKPNGGLSDARNAGLDIALGDYYCFVDSDDILPEHSLTTLHDLISKHDSDMVIAGFERFHGETGEVFFSTESEGIVTHVYTREEAVKDFYRDGCQSWAVLYKRHIHEHIRFPKGEINEDEAIIFQILENCSRVVVTNQVVYSYRCREESITTSEFSEQKFVWYRHCVDNHRWMVQHYPRFVDLACNRVCCSLLWAAREIALSSRAFPQIEAVIKSEIREHYFAFMRTGLLSRQAAIRLWVLYALPFAVYRKLERWIAGKGQ